MLHHNLDELLETGGLRVPAQLALGLRGVAPEVDHVGGTIEVLAHGHERLAHKVGRTSRADALLVDALALPAQFNACKAEGQRGKLAHGVLHASGDDEILGRGVLEDEPHTLHVVLGIAPVAQGVEVAQIEAVLLALRDARGSQRNLARDEGFAAALALVVEEDARAAEHIVCLAILLDNPVAIEFGHRVGTIGMEGRLLVLRHFLHLAVQLGGGSLVYLARLLQVIGAHGFEDAQHTNGIYIGRKLGRIKTHLHVALRGEVVDFRGLHLANEFDQRHRVGHVGIVKVEAGLAFEVGNALAVVHGRTADDAVHFVALGQEKLGKITAILSRHTRN